MTQSVTGTPIHERWQQNMLEAEIKDSDALRLAASLIENHLAFDATNEGRDYWKDVVQGLKCAASDYEQL